VVIVDMPPDNSYGDLGFIAGLAFQPVLGEALWRSSPTSRSATASEVAFAPGFDVPDEFVEDVKRLTYTAYDDSPGGNDDFLDEESLDQRMKASGKAADGPDGGRRADRRRPPARVGPVRGARPRRRDPPDRRRRPLP
jgi:hypothetical protein